MMTFLPVVLSAVGRWVFWPRKPRTDGATDLATHGLWGRIADVVGAETGPRGSAPPSCWRCCSRSASASLQTPASPPPRTSPTSPTPSAGRHSTTRTSTRVPGRPPSSATNASTVDAVIAAASGVEVCGRAPGSVCVQVDIEKVRRCCRTPVAMAAAPARLPPRRSTVNVAPIDGRTIVNVAMADSYDSPEALETVERLRDTLHAVCRARMH